MSVLGSVMQNIFGNSQPASQQPVATQKTPGNMPITPTSIADPNNPTNPITVTEPTAPASPLDQFKDLWQTDPNAVKPAENKIFENLTPDKIAAAAKNNDFSKVLTPEMQSALQKGGPEATQVMLQVMNAMSQKSFGDSAVATTKIVEMALAKQQENFLAQLPNIIKNQNLSENLRSSNPIFSNPAVAPMLDLMKTQVAAKHPTLSAAEQAKMAQDYVLAFAAAANPNTQTASQAASSDTDWSTFLQ